MTLVDLEDLLQAISSEAPCGGDLEYDPDYIALERATQGKPEQQFGTTIVPAQGPDWIKVQHQALALLGRTKDLRVAVFLTQALAHTQGWTGLHDGLTLLDGLLARYWPTIHPQLDPSDDNDPTLRVNTITSLSDREAMLEVLRAAPLVSSPMLGTFTLRDVQIATRELPLPKDSQSAVQDIALIESALREIELSALQDMAETLSQSIELIAALESRFVAQVGVEAAPDLAALTDLVRAAHKVLQSPLAERAPVPPSSEEEAPVSDDPPTGGPGAAVAGQAAASTIPGTINGRSDVIRLLDQLCDYYRRQEPSSPVPILLQRAKRLVSKDFLEILQDLAPDGLAQARAIRGPDADQ